MEKPVAMRAYEVEEMIEKRNGLTTVVGFKKAFMPSTVKAVEIAHSEQYDRLLQTRSDWSINSKLCYLSRKKYHIGCLVFELY
jgi:predicted dehydrogenase